MMTCAKCGYSLDKLHTLLGEVLRFCPACGAPVGKLEQLKERFETSWRNLADLYLRRALGGFDLNLNRQIDAGEEALAKLDAAIAKLETRKETLSRELAFLREKRAVIERVAAQHRDNAMTLDGKASMYGMDAPIDLLNAQDREREEIRRLTQEIEMIGHAIYQIERELGTS